MEGYVLSCSCFDFQPQCQDVVVSWFQRGFEADRFSSLNAAEQREFQNRMERKQLKEFMTVRANSIDLSSPPFSAISGRATNPNPPIHSLREITLSSPHFHKRSILSD